MSNPTPNGTLLYAANDDYGRLVALLDERRKMVKRHSLAKKRPSRKQMTLADKLEVDRKHGDELAKLNEKINELMRATRGEQGCISK